MAQVCWIDFRSAAQRRREEIIESYAPYHRYDEFGVGLADYESFAKGGELRQNPYDGGSVAAQAWDHGFEAGKHIRIANAGPACQGWRP
jgi:hypothetical protein